MRVFLARENKYFLALIVISLLLACESENEHFCSKYEFYYQELSAPDILPPAAIRSQLNDELLEPNSDKERLALMLKVLNDKQAERIIESESPRDFCMRTQGWKSLRP